MSNLGEIFQDLKELEDRTSNLKIKKHQLTSMISTLNDFINKNENSLANYNELLIAELKKDIVSLNEIKRVKVLIETTSDLIDVQKIKKSEYVSEITKADSEIIKNKDQIKELKRLMLDDKCKILDFK